MPCMHTCGLRRRLNNVAVHDPWAGTFHCVTLRSPPPSPHRKTLHPSLDPVECPLGPTERTAACCQLGLIYIFFLPSALSKKHTSQPARQSWSCWIMLQLLFISSEEECLVFFSPSAVLLFFYFSSSLCNRGIRLLLHRPPSPPSYFGRPLYFDQSL